MKSNVYYFLITLNKIFSFKAYNENIEKMI